MGKKRFLVFHNSNTSKRSKKSTPTLGYTGSAGTRGGRCKKVGGRYSILPSSPPLLAYRPSPRLPDQPESPIGGYLSPVPQNHSSPYPTRKSRNAIGTPQFPFNSNIASPIFTPPIPSSPVTSVPSRSLRHSSPVSALPNHSPPLLASPIPTRTTRSRRRNFPNEVARSVSKRAASGKPATLRSTERNSLHLEPTTPEQLNATRDLSRSPPIDIPTPFKNSTKAEVKKPRKKAKRALVYHPPKTTKKKKKVIPNPKRPTMRKEKPHPEAERDLSPKFVPVKVEGGEMINLQVHKLRNKKPLTDGPGVCFPIPWMVRQVTHRAESMKSSWKKSGDIRFSVGTTTQQFRWGLMEVVPSGSKPASLCDDWMLFTILSGSAVICIDNEIRDSLYDPGDTLLVPPGHSYHISNVGNKLLKLLFNVITLT